MGRRLCRKMQQAPETRAKEKRPWKQRKKYYDDDDHHHHHHEHPRTTATTTSTTTTTTTTVLLRRRRPTTIAVAPATPVSAPTPHVVAQVCREARARVACHVRLADMNLERRRKKTSMCPLTRRGEPHPRARRRPAGPNRRMPPASRAHRSTAYWTSPRPKGRAACRCDPRRRCKA